MKTKINISKTILIVIILMLFILPVHALMLEDAKVIVDNYYQYSKEKNVDAYSELFDKEYASEIYGENYKIFFKEVLNYADISNYEISYQYYSESDESLTLFFNLKGDALVEDQSVKMDNDLVAFFSKTDNVLKLRYIILQETFIEQMNREVIYMSAIASMTEEQSDLKKEAEEKGIELIDYKSLFEERINNHNNKSFFWIIAIIALIILGLFIFKKEQSIKIYNNTKNRSKNIYNKNFPIIYTYLKKISTKIHKLLKNSYNNFSPIVQKHSKKFTTKTKKIIKKNKILSQKNESKK
jgi:hypothetical protein